MRNIISLQPSDIVIQIVPKNPNESLQDTVYLPDKSEGYIVPINLFFVDNVGKDFCGAFELKTIYYNNAIKRDIINELYDSGKTFDIYIRLNSSKENIESPKVLQIFNNVSINGRELLIPEFGQIITYRYYFTNNSDPWNIPIEKIEALRPPNQYIYDYAVSKAIKDQTTAIKEIKDEIVKELIMQRPL
jgi:hypothetical protein